MNFDPITCGTGATYIENTRIDNSSFFLLILPVYYTLKCKINKRIICILEKFWWLLK